MNKAQKITIAITLLIMAFLLIYPPVGRIAAGQGVKITLAEGRSLVFLLRDLQLINVASLVAELLAISFIGGALTVLFSLKKK